MAETIAIHRYEKVWAFCREASMVLGLTGLTVLGAKIVFPLPWTPVPVTLQVAAVVFAGAAFGSRRGILSQLLYLGLGICGLPVFASSLLAGPAVILEPSFGYLLAFPAAAWLAGRWSSKKGRWLSAASALAVIYAFGVSWLMIWYSVSSEPISIAWAMVAGLLPFLPVDICKAALAVLGGAPIRKRLP